MVNCMYFFFQAEDGIRDLTVTGVQTCALPILSKCSIQYLRINAADCESFEHLLIGNNITRRALHANRSEERRVGKECRSQGAPNHEKKKRLRLHEAELALHGGWVLVDRSSDVA